MALLASLASCVCAVLAQNPLRVPLGGLVIMQTDPAHAHVFYAEPAWALPMAGVSARSVVRAGFFFFD